MALPGSTHSTAAALKEDMPGFSFDNYARNASLPLEKKMQMPTVCSVWGVCGRRRTRRACVMFCFL